MKFQLSLYRHANNSNFSVVFQYFKARTSGDRPLRPLISCALRTETTLINRKTTYAFKYILFRKIPQCIRNISVQLIIYPFSRIRTIVYGLDDENKRSSIDYIVKMAAHAASASLFMNGKHVVIVSRNHKQGESACYFKTRARMDQRCR